MAQPSHLSERALKETRLSLKEAFLKEQNAPLDLHISFLAGDCSFRTYDRLQTQQAWFASSVVLMDAPPPHESLAPFLKVSTLLEEQGLRVPRIYAFDETHGFILLEDFGDLTYKRALQNSSLKETLYLASLETLLKIQTISAAHLLPVFDIEALVKEMESLFTWGLPYSLTPEEKEQVKDLWREELAPIPDFNTQQPALVLRDYHVDNLMVLPGKGVTSCGLLDFQDALWGTKAYDLVSILQDARFDVGESFEEDMKQYFIQQQESSFDEDMFQAAYTLLGLQRSAKILGIFLRRARKDKRPEMLTHLPRVWRYIERSLESSLTQHLRPWFKDMFPHGAPHA